MSAFDTLVQEIIDYTKRDMNVMLIGRHGVGKTAAIQEACRREGWSMWYASAPLLDPDIDLGGIPVPNRETGVLDFFAQPHLATAEVLFLDELNRASPRTLNMVFELIQFKSVHGKRLPKLRVVHTGINPPGQGAYDVQVLDEALMDRFHAFIEVTAEFPLALIKPILGEPKALAMEAWYKQYLTDEFVSPRRMVYAAQAYAAGMPLHQAFLSHKLPLGRLKDLLSEAELGALVQPVLSPSAELEAIYMEPAFQEPLNNPELAQQHEIFAKVLAEFGLTPKEVMAEVQAIRARKEEG